MSSADVPSPSAESLRGGPLPVPAPSARQEARIGGIDAARALAIVGMVMVHFGPTDIGGGGALAWLYPLPHGRASILFVGLAGIGVSLLAGARREPAAAARRRRRAAAVLVQRTVVLLPVGLALQLLDHGVLVILQYYALYFLVGAVALWWPQRWLLWGAVAVAVGGPVLHLATWRALPAWFTRPPVELGDPAGVVIVDLLVAGSYPVVTWSAPLLLGMWLGRQDLRSATVRFRLVAGGAVVAVLAWALSATLVVLLGAPAPPPSWEQLVSAEPHSQMPLWLIGSAASASAVTGLMLVVVDRLRRVAWPLVALGQLALTVYVVHLLVLAVDPDLLRRADAGAALRSVLRFAVVAAGLSVLWRWHWPRGPLEALLRWPHR